MKWFANIFVLFLIWLTCSAVGCNENARFTEMRSQRQIGITRDSLKQVFEADSPGDNFLRAYEATAIQKLADFADYVKIASDSSVDKVFRMQAAVMARKLFNSGRTDISGWDEANPSQKSISVETLLDNCLGNRFDFYIIPGQVNIRAALEMGNDSLFKGKLSFYPQLIYFRNSDVSEKKRDLIFVDFFARKETKNFGNEKLEIWSVFLGEIKLSP